MRGRLGKRTRTRTRGRLGKRERVKKDDHFFGGLDWERNGVKDGRDGVKVRKERRD